MGKNETQFPESITCLDHLLSRNDQTVQSQKFCGKGGFLHFIHFPKNELAGFQMFTDCDNYLLIHCVRNLWLNSCKGREQVKMIF